LQFSLVTAIKLITRQAGAILQNKKGKGLTHHHNIKEKQLWLLMNKNAEVV
jgi:hypothetical protein